MNGTMIQFLSRFYKTFYEKGFFVYQMINTVLNKNY